MKYIIFIIGLIAGLGIHNAVARIINYNVSTDAWISFYGAIGGGIITFLGVLLSLNHNQKMIKESFEQEQLVKTRPWIKVESFKSNILLSHVETQEIITVFLTEDYKTRERYLESELEKRAFLSEHMEGLKDFINLKGRYIYHSIENISNNPLLGAEYMLNYKYDEDNEIEELRVSLGDIKGNEKVYVPLPYPKKPQMKFILLEIRGKSIHNEDMYYKEKFIENNANIIEISHEKINDDLKREVKLHETKFITKEANEEFRRRYIQYL